MVRTKAERAKAALIVKRGDMGQEDGATRRALLETTPRAVLPDAAIALGDTLALDQPSRDVYSVFQDDSHRQGICG
jgi:hypothetical protein